MVALNDKSHSVTGFNVELMLLAYEDLVQLSVLMEVQSCRQS